MYRGFQGPHNLNWSRKNEARGSDEEWSYREHLKSKHQGEDIVIREWHAYNSDSWAVSEADKVVDETSCLKWKKEDKR